MATRTQSLILSGSLITFASLPTEWHRELDTIRCHFWSELLFRKAISRVQTLALSNMAQAKFLPHFHQIGFEKVSIPREMYARILTGRKKALMEKRWKSIKTWTCMQEIQGGRLSPVILGCRTVRWLWKANMQRRVTWWDIKLAPLYQHLKKVFALMCLNLQINREIYFYLGLDVKLQKEIYREMRQLAQVQKYINKTFAWYINYSMDISTTQWIMDISTIKRLHLVTNMDFDHQTWIKNRVELIGTSIYGIRYSFRLFKHIYPEWSENIPMGQSLCRTLTIWRLTSSLRSWTSPKRFGHGNLSPTFDTRWRSHGLSRFWITAANSITFTWILGKWWVVFL